MGERLKKYLKRTEERIEYLAQAKEDSDLLKERLAKEKAELLVQIGFFQHERLIHLIVTVLFALMTMLVFLLAMTNFTPWTGVLLLLLLALLIPYIRHYWLLENGTQKLYQYYDKMEEMYNGEDEVSSINL
jgi:hypothetical protein